MKKNSETVYSGSGNVNAYLMEVDEPMDIGFGNVPIKASYIVLLRRLLDVSIGFGNDEGSFGYRFSKLGAFKYKFTPLAEIRPELEKIDELIKQHLESDSIVNRSLSYANEADQMLVDGVQTIIKMDNFLLNLAERSDSPDSKIALHNALNETSFETAQMAEEIVREIVDEPPEVSGEIERGTNRLLDDRRIAQLTCYRFSDGQLANMEDVERLHNWLGLNRNLFEDVSEDVREELYRLVQECAKYSRTNSASGILDQHNRPSVVDLPTYPREGIPD